MVKRDRAEARLLMKAIASSLHLLSRSSQHFAPLSQRARCNTPSVVAALGHALLQEVSALQRAMSTANCAPRCNGKPHANTSMDLSPAASTTTLQPLAHSGQLPERAQSS